MQDSMDAYARLQGVALRGGTLRVHGAAQLFASRADCAAACSASVDCTGFVYGLRDRFCTFKRLGALAAANLGPASGKDTYIKKKGGKAWAADDQAMPRVRWSPEPNRLNISSLASDSDTPSASAIGPRVMAVHGLLSEDEAGALRDFAWNCFRRERRSRGGYAVPSSAATTTEKMVIGQSVECPAGTVAGILSRLEVRISGLTGLALHEEEEPLLLTRQRPKGPDGPWLDASSVHHDRMSLDGLHGHAERRELRITSRREVTVLSYLTGVDEGQGGHTIFPTMRPRSRSRERLDDGSALRLAAFAATVQAAFEAGVRSLGRSQAEPLCSVAQHADAEPLLPDVAEAREAVRRHAEAECERALHNASQGLAIKPQAGLSLAFWHDDPRMWHAGCVGRSTPGRLTLQKFKTPVTAEAAAELRRAWAADADAEPAALRAWANQRARPDEDKSQAAWEEDDMEDLLASTEHAMCVAPACTSETVPASHILVHALRERL